MEENGKKNGKKKKQEIIISYFHKIDYISDYT